MSVASDIIASLPPGPPNEIGEWEGWKIGDAPARLPWAYNNLSGTTRSAYLHWIDLRAPVEVRTSLAEAALAKALAAARAHQSETEE